MIEALGHREQERDDAERLLAMLRVTLNERIKQAERLAECDDAAHGLRASAYRDVLSLLGPEEPDTYDPEAPF